MPSETLAALTNEHIARRLEERQRRRHQRERDAYIQMLMPKDKGFTAMNIDQLRNVPHSIAKVLRDMRKDVAAVNADPHLSQEGRDAKITERRQQARAEIAKIAAGAKGVEAAVRDSITATLAGPNRDDDTAYQLRYDRMRDRLGKLLSGPDPDIHKVIDRVKGDALALTVLKEEAPYIVSDSSQLAAVNDALDAAEEPHLSVAQREAKALASQLDRGSYKLNMSVQTALNEVEGGDPATVVAFDSDDLIDVGAA
jgi:hypothetical protein